MVTRWRRSTGIACLTAILVVAAGCSSDPRDEDVKRMLVSWERAEPAPLFSVLRDEPLSIEQAYNLQARAVRDRLDGEPPLGFKAGLTSQEQQQRFAMHEPVAGVLWPGRALDASSGEVTIRKADMQQPMIEVELAFRIARPIREPLTELADVHSAVSEVMAALELPDMAFQQGNLLGSDIIAGNAASAYYVTGPGLPVAGRDINQISARLYHNDELLQEAHARAVLGDQWTAIQWTINRLLANGWTLEPGQLLLTGAMAAMLPLEYGRYHADFGELGTLLLSVE